MNGPRAMLITMSLSCFVIGAFVVYHHIQTGYPSYGDALIGWLMTGIGGFVAIVAMLYSGRK